MSRTPVGTVRPSQLLWTYGPGALIDLPNLSVVTMGLGQWDTDRCPPLEEARLLDQVRRIHGPQVGRLRTPPVVLDDNVDPFSAEAQIGVPVRPFPRWLRCTRCGLLSQFDSGLFRIKEEPYHPDRTRFLHSSCEKGNKSDAVPARFLVGCQNGHLDDFPWHYYVHRGRTGCRGTLRFFERGASLQTENLWVKCDTCGDKRSLVQAFGREAKNNLPACRGRHPHLDEYDPDCDIPLTTVLLGQTNTWFPIAISVLSIPHAGDSLAQLVADAWEDLQEAEDAAELRGMLKGFKKRGVLQGIERYAADEVWEAVEKRRSGDAGDETIGEGDIKRPEWEVLTHPSPPSDWPHFLSESVPVPKGYENVIEDVLLLKRLREVRALVGYARIDAPDDTGDPDEGPAMAALCKGPPDWVPAAQVHGEGIFIRFDEDAIQAWEQRSEVGSRDVRLQKGHEGWRNARHLDPERGYPGVRYALLHTFSHLLLRELALECGYSSASIRERIYAESGDSPMAGVLLYTAAADSDGTLGGLVDLGKAANLGRILRQAINRATICSSDPICSEHDPEKDRSLHAAACHACAFVSETSCERNNRYLDRGLLVSTFEAASAVAAFFAVEDTPNG